MKIDQILLPGITLLPILGVIVLLIWKGITKKQAAVIGILSEGCALAIALVLLSSLRESGSVVFSVPWIKNLNVSLSLELNWLSLVFLLTEILVTLVAMVYSLGDQDGQKNCGRYYALLLLFSLGMSGTTLAEDVFLFYVFWELMLIASVLLILGWGHGPNRFGVALKYFIITHIGSLMVLICLITLVVNTGTASLNQLVQQSGSLPANLRGFLIAFFIIGFCVKMAIFPLHFWLPDAHTVAPMPVTIILAAAMLSMGTYGVLRFPIFLFGLDNLKPFAVWMMVGGIISEVYGALMAFAEKDIKRIIAYSSVSQMGYILFGLGSLTEQGLLGGILHVVYHAIVKALLFMVVGILISHTGERHIDRMGGLAGKIPLVAACAAIGVLGISGMPPLGIFNSEWMIFSGGFDSGYSISLPIISLLASIFTLVYALRFFGKIFIGKLKPSRLAEKINLWALASTVAVAVFLMVEGLFPDPLLAWSMSGLESVLPGGFK